MTRGFGGPAAYRLLLRLLPRSFREEFADEMTAVFAEQRRRAGGGAAFSLWMRTVVELITLAARLRIDQTRVDTHHAIRSLTHQKTFAITAVTTLALALGPATAVFSLVHGVLLDPLPGARGLDRVVFAWASNPERDRHELPWSELNFVDHRDRRQGLAALGAMVPTSATFGGDAPQQVEGAWTSEDMFDVLGIDAAQGRRFTAADMQPGAAPVIILGHDFAATRFPSQPAVGQTLQVDGRPTTVVGVLPRGFRFPAGEPHFWQPLTLDRSTSNRSQTYLRVLGRLADDATMTQVEQQMNAVAIDLEKQFPASNAGSRVELVDAGSYLTRGTRRIVSILGFAAIAIFLLACTNIASLLLVRTSGRAAELSVRTALGACAARLSRQFLIEHLVLAAVSAVAAVGVASLLLRLLALTRLVPVHQLARATLDATSMLFLIGLMTLTAVTLGWIASRRAAKTAAMTTGLRTQSASRETVRLRQALVGVEVGAAVVLLLAAGLLLQSAARLVRVDPGFRSENVITFQVGLPMSRYAELPSRVRFIDAVVEKLAALPGVSAAASGAFAPMTSMRATRRFAVEGKPLPTPGSEPVAIDLPAGPAYASVMGLRLIDGRWINDSDRPDSPPVVVISESFARQHFPGERAVGRRLRHFTARPNTPQPPSPEIVGVVSDVRQFAMAEPEMPQMYVPHAQRPWNFTSFFVRSAGDPRAVIGSLDAAVHAVDPERPIENARTVSDLVSDSTADRRALSALLVLAAIVAVLIATVGVYGVTAATTNARRRELAIRAAIGASRAGLLGLVIRQGLVAATIGIAAGLASGIAAASVLESVLYEVPARDPWTIATAGLSILALCALATYLPARRAVSASPAIALNQP
jgi:putative ABC transport system permease protein